MVQSIEYRLYNKADWSYAEVGQADPTADLPNRKAAYPTDANTSITVWGWKNAISGLKDLNSDKYKIYSTNKTVTVEGVNSQVDLFDLGGRRIQSQKLSGTFISKSLNAGLYILRVDGGTRKIAVN